MTPLVEDLLRDDELIETHISWILRREFEVLKIKKPVDLGFLDFSDIEKRRIACLAEVKLNRRLAPSIYLGVERVTRDEQGTHALAGQGETVDWAVRMQRLPDSDRADIRLQEGRLQASQLDLIVTRLARFHEGLEAHRDVDTGMDNLRKNIAENFDQTRQILPHYLSAHEQEELVVWQSSFIERNEAVFVARIEAGRIREGHGDLRLEHIYLRDDGTMNVLDCIEFNERFRIADICADIVFLAMDCASRGRADLGERILAIYARESGDFDMYAVSDFYESYRAFVRGKVAAMTASTANLDPRAKEEAEDSARRHFLLALAAKKRSVLPPLVIVVGGIIASGKSTLANRIAAAISAPVVCADRTRKELAGVAATQHVKADSFAGMYSLDFTDKTYREVVRRGEQVIRSGRSVVLDATFRTRELRDLARQMARRCEVDFVFVECRVDQQTCLERLRAREATPGVSDGRVEILAGFMRKWEPVTELDDSQHLVVDTGRAIDESMAQLRRALPIWPSAA